MKSFNIYYIILWMKKYFTAGIVTIFALTIVVAMYMKINQILIPKHFDDAFPVSATTAAFYELPKDSIDVLFLGSSHGATFFSPEVLDEDFGITSYSLCTEMQNMVISYYWLKEAIRSQSPKVVVLDSMMAFDFMSEEVLNSSEGVTRKAIDYMKWSPVKMELAYTLNRLDRDTYPLGDLLIPAFRYHDTWKDIDEQDFLSVKELLGDYSARGYVYTEGGEEKNEYYPFEKGYENVTPMRPLMKEYLEKIVLLCKENNIGLITVQVPTVLDDPTKYPVSTAFAAENGIVNVDFNQKLIYETVGYNFEKDNVDNSHGNENGAKKVTSFIGQVLTLQFGIGTQ